jgi:hypothetical protein
MKKFTKITKKHFIGVLTESSVILMGAGFTSSSLEDEVFEATIIDVCEKADVDALEQCYCTTQSNALVRHLPDGSKSYFYFDGKNSKRAYYEYGNIVIAETIYNDSDRRNYVTYLCV